MSTNDISSVKARLEVLKDLKDSVKDRFFGLLGIRQPKVLLEDEQEVYLQVGRTVWHAPRQLRTELWLSSLARRHALVSEYQTYLAQDITREASVDIEKDVQRTFPNTRRFKAEEGQAQLRNVLRAYAAYDPEVAYCQGMNFLTGLLLMYMPSEAHAFAALVVLMEDRKLRSFYHRSMALLQVQLWQLSRLISPPVNQHLEGLGVVPMLYGASWLMTAFSADFPIPFSARIMDVLLADQCECALLKVATAIIKAVEQRLKAMSDLEDVLSYLKIDVPAWDETELHALLTAAFTKPWTSRQLAVLRTTEGAETVAQAMDRVMTMNEQLTAQVSCEEDEVTEDGEHQEPRVPTIPRLNPPPQPAHSFATSPACGTPITGGGLVLGMGSYGGAGSPPASAPSSARCHVMHQVTGYGGPSTSTSCGGAVSGGPSGSTGGAAGGTCAGAAGANGMSQSGASSPAVWGIPCIHPNVPASPAIQAFRRAHFNSFQAAVAAMSSGRNGRLIPFQHGRHLHSAGSGVSEGGCVVEEDEDIDLEGDVHHDKVALGKSSSPSNDGNASLAEEWGEFNAAAAARQQWRSVMRSTPGSTRHVLLHPVAASCGTAEGDMTPREGPWSGSGPCLGAAPIGGASTTPTQDVQSSANGFSRASQPIPVPGTSAFAVMSRTGTGSGSGSSGITSAFANPSPANAAAGSGASSGKPPLPPRCSSFDRGPQLFVPGSRLSVVTEDPLAVQMGPAAPAPSPRGSMDLHVGLGRSSSQPLEAYEQYGLLLYGTTATGGAVAGCGSFNGDFASGSASGTTAGVLASPSGISGGVSPHPTSPRLPSSSWAACSSAVGTTPGDGHGGETPSAGYTLLGMDRTTSGSLQDVMSAGGGGVLNFVDRSTGATSPSVLPKLPTIQPVDKSVHPLAVPQHQATDMATDIAGDILRMLSAVDTCNANAAYDPRTVLGESMYADSPNKENTELVRRGSESHLRHLPSSSKLDEIAAQDLAKAQAEAERVRQQLEARLQQQRAAERNSIAAPGTACSVEAMPLPQLDDAAPSNPPTDAPTAPEATGTMLASASALPDTVEAVATEASGTNGAPAAVASAAGSDRAGVAKELVFKRPTLYVDGIPMFDPKSLMADSSEAQVMFTPAVSPGASSYADPHVPGFTPTAEPATPVDPDLSGAPESGVPTSEACPLLREDVVDEVAQAQMMEEAEAEGYTAAAAEAEGDDGIEYTCVSGVGLQEALEPVSEPQLGASPSASEWVDWSQAPPLQVQPAMVVPPIQEVMEVTATTMTAQRIASIKPPDRAGVEAPHVHIDNADDAHLQEEPTLSAEASLPVVIEHQRETLLGENLIDMASPVRPLPPCVSAHVDGPRDSVSFSPLTSYGTGLSPVAVRNTSGLRYATPRLHQEDPCDEHSLADVPSDYNLVYGLLPMTSTTSCSFPVTTITGRTEGVSRLSAMTPMDSVDIAAFSSHAPRTGSPVWDRPPAVLDRRDNDGGVPALLAASGMVSPLVPEPTPGATAQTHTGNDRQQHTTFEVYPTSIASAVASAGHPEVGRGREEAGISSEVHQGGAAASTTDLLWLAAQKIENNQLAIGTDVFTEVHDLLGPSHMQQLIQDAHSRHRHLPTPSDTEDAVSDARSDRGTEAGLSGVQTPPEQETSCMGGVCDGEASDVGEVENSPFRIALSPSLANHIMSVYSRSEVHQREQEKREAEERLQRELEERQRREAEERLRWEQELQLKQPRAGVGQLQESEQLVVRSAAASSRDSTLFESAVSALSGLSMAASSLHPSATVGVLASASDVAAVAAVPVLIAAGSSCGAGLGEAMHSVNLVQTATEDTSKNLIPAPVASAPRLGSGLVSPVLDSPGRMGYSASSLSFAAGSQSAHAAAGTATSTTYQPPRPQTPFAVTLDDPSAARMSAEVLAALSPPPPLGLLHSDTSVLHSAAGSFLVPLTTLCLDAQLFAAGSARGSLRCTGSGEGEPAQTAGATSSGHMSAVGSNTLFGFGSGHSKSSGGALHLDLVSYGTQDTSTGGCPPTPGGTRVAMTNSSGGAVPPLLPPPPPPQVPLCSSAQASAATATTPGPAPPPHVALPSVPCSSTVTMNAGAIIATAAANTPVIANAAALSLIPAVAPAWTATFDGIDDSVTHEALVGKGCDAEVKEGCAQPRQLSSAFAEEARDMSSPMLPVPDSCGVSATTTGINTPEARLHTPDMARGMSIEALQLPSAPSPAPQMQL